MCLILSASDVENRDSINGDDIVFVSKCGMAQYHDDCIFNDSYRLCSNVIVVVIVKEKKEKLKIKTKEKEEEEEEEERKVLAHRHYYYYYYRYYCRSTTKKIDVDNILMQWILPISIILFYVNNHDEYDHNHSSFNTANIININTIPIVFNIIYSYYYYCYCYCYCYYVVYAYLRHSIAIHNILYKKNIYDNYKCIKSASNRDNIHFDIRTKNVSDNCSSANLSVFNRVKRSRQCKISTKSVSIDNAIRTMSDGANDSDTFQTRLYDQQWYQMETTHPKQTFYDRINQWRMRSSNSFYITIESGQDALINTSPPFLFLLY